MFIPNGFGWERLRRDHPRSQFQCSEAEVNEWLRTKARQHQKKQLSVTQLLLDPEAQIAGYYTLATGQVGLGEFPDELSKNLPRRALPMAVLAWLGVAEAHQGQGLGKLSLLKPCATATKRAARFLSWRWRSTA